MLLMKYEASIVDNPSKTLFNKKPSLSSIDANATGNFIHIFNPTSAQWNSEVDLFAFLLAVENRQLC